MGGASVRHLGTCLGEKNWGALIEAHRGPAKR